MIVSYLSHHRPAVVDLLKRSLLPEDAVDAEAIVEVLSRGTSLAPTDSADVIGARGTGVVALRDGDVVGVAIASIGHGDPSVAHLDLLAVDPAHRRQGRGRRLVAEVERRMKAFGLTAIRARGNPPDYAWPGVDVRYTPSVCALLALGYTHERTAWNMTAKLTPGSPALRETSSAEQRLARAGVVVRTAGVEDLPALSAAVTPEWGALWAAEVERAITGSGGCHLALRDDEPIAFAVWGSCRPGWFGPMGTLPAAEGLGIGSVLLRRCLRDQAALGLTEVQIGWVGPISFYSAVAGARIERVFFILHKPLA